jgi:hypothetical protein
MFFFIFRMFLIPYKTYFGVPQLEKFVRCTSNLAGCSPLSFYRKFEQKHWPRKGNIPEQIIVLSLSRMSCSAAVLEGRPCPVRRGQSLAAAGRLLLQLLVSHPIRMCGEK